MSVFAWGTNKNGELGTGELEDCLDPVLCELLKGKRMVQVSCGERHSVAVSEHGALYVWGRGREGQIGDGSSSYHNPQPKRVQALRQERIVKAACGYDHVLALTDTGKVFQWGKLYRQQAGGSVEDYFGISINLPGFDRDMIAQSHRAYYAGEVQNSAEMDESAQLTNFGKFTAYLQRTPELVAEPLAGQHVTDIAAGYSFSVAVTADGQCYAWGFNDKFQCGQGHRYNQDTPARVRLPEGVRIVQVACGQQHTLALTSDGDVWSWGLGVFGQLGHERAKDQTRPKLIEALAGRRVVRVACGAYHALCCTFDGSVYTWGSAEYGQQGGAIGNYNDWGSGERGKEAHNATPRRFDALTGKNILSVACGHLFNLAVSHDGELFTWGWGATGGLGHGNRRFQLMPLQVMRLKGERIVGVAAGGKHAVAITEGSSSTFAFDFKPFVNSKALADLIFRVEGKPIYAHRCIVFARCPYLKALCAMNSRFGMCAPEVEVRTRYTVFVAFLHYLYTDHFKLSSHLSQDLVALAKKVKLPRLEQLATRTQHGLGEKLVLMPSTFGEDMRQIMDEASMADVQFRLEDDGGHVVHAHKLILSARSDYFRTIFDCAFREHSQQCIVIPSLDYRTFLSVLQFIYAGDESVVQSERIVDVLVAADRFLLDDLKQLCEAELEHALDVENCSLLLEVGDRHNAPRLRRICFETALKHWDSFKTTKGFGQMSQDPTLMSLLRELDYNCVQKKLVTRPGEALRLAQMASTPAPSLEAMTNTLTAITTNTAPVSGAAIAAAAAAAATVAAAAAAATSPALIASGNAAANGETAAAAH